MCTVDRYIAYSDGASENVKKVEEMIRKGAVISRCEGFDVMFKAFVSGENRINLRKDLGISIFDRDLAKFYAKFFMKMLDFREGYSFQMVKSFTRQLLREAWLGGLLRRKYSVRFDDKNGVLRAIVHRGSKDTYEFLLHNKREVIIYAIAMISVIGSDDEIEDFEFFCEYIYNEYQKLDTGIKPEVYTDKLDRGLKYMLRADKIRRSANAVKSAMAERERDTESKSKIIQYRVG